jgi:hypothetical protein
MFQFYSGKKFRKRCKCTIVTIATTTMNVLKYIYLPTPALQCTTIGAFVTFNSFDNRINSKNIFVLFGTPTNTYNADINE